MATETNTKTGTDSSPDAASETALDAANEVVSDSGNIFSISDGGSNGNPSGSNSVANNWTSQSPGEDPQPQSAGEGSNEQLVDVCFDIVETEAEGTSGEWNKLMLFNGDFNNGTPLYNGTVLQKTTCKKAKPKDIMIIQYLSNHDAVCCSFFMQHIISHIYNIIYVTYRMLR